MRTKYPDLVFGAISSSGVTHAQVDFPQYFDAATKYGPKECIAGLQHSIAEIDSFLDNESTNKQIKDLFGLGVLNNGDFGSAIIGPIYSWQNMYYSSEWKGDQADPKGQLRRLSSTVPPLSKRTRPRRCLLLVTLPRE